MVFQSAFFLLVLCQISVGTYAQNVSAPLLNFSALPVGIAATNSSAEDTVIDLSNPDNNDLFASTARNMTCDGLYAFERTLDSGVSPAMVLVPANRTQTPIANTSEIVWNYPCNQMCQEKDGCVAYITNYNTLSCLLLSQRPKQSRAELVSLTGLAYYEKICLKIPRDMKCRKEWAFERVVGMELTNFDDSVIHNLHTRAECMTACLTEEAFVCRSARFNYQTNDCHLSRHSRRTMPSAFHPTTDQVDYLENQCAPEPQMCDYRQVEDKLFSVEKEVDQVDNASTCQQFCRNNEPFVCRAYRYDESLKQCLLSADDRTSITAIRSSTVDQGQQQFLGFMERAECIDISMSCGPVSMTASLKLNRPFNGRFYTADKPNLCVVVGNNDFEVQLVMALEGQECGTQSLGNGTFVNDVVVQMHPIVLRDSDRRVRIACDYPSSKVTLTDDLTVNGVPPRFMDPNQANATQTVSGIAALPKVRLQIRNGSGKEVQGAQLGDSLILSIDMVEEASAFGIAASDLQAMSGSGEETLQLLDGRGCPVEPSIFPTLSRIHDGRSLTSRFAAFKFASDSIVKFRVVVSFCLDSCPLPDCSAPASNSVRKRRSVANANISAPIEERELTMELAILVDTDSNKAPMIGKDGVVNEALAAKLRNTVCTKSALIWGLGITAVIIQVVTLSCCVASVTMYRQLKRQKGDIFESPSSTTQTTLAWNSQASGKNPDLFRMYK